MTKAAFNPARIAITEFAATRLSEPEGPHMSKYAVRMALSLREATDGFTTVEEVVIRATMDDPQASTPKQIADALLDLLVLTLARERAGIRPGTPTPEALLSVVRGALGLPQEP